MFRVWDKINKEYIHCFLITEDGEIIIDGIEVSPMNYILELSIGYRYYDTYEPIFFGDIVKAPSGLLLEVIWYDDEMRIALCDDNKQIYNFNIPLYKKYGTIHDKE